MARHAKGISVVVEPPHPVGGSPVGESLQRLPGRAVLAVLSVEALAVLLVMVTITVPTGGELTLAAFLTLLSLVHTELATGVERIRRSDAETSYFDLSSVWTFAAAVLLPPTLAAPSWCGTDICGGGSGAGGVPLYRPVYTTATVVLAALRRTPGGSRRTVPARPATCSGRRDRAGGLYVGEHAAGRGGHRARDRRRRPGRGPRMVGR